MTLTEFLLARIAEDEAVSPTGRRPSPRDIAECEAKRRIVELAAKAEAWGEGTAGATAGYAKVVASDTLRLLTLPYADHPDYREEWRP